MNSGLLFETVALEKEFDGGSVLALRGVSLGISEGEFLAITGRSGSGKTTLLHILGGIEHPTAGAVKYRGESLGSLNDLSRYRAREVGYIFQSFFLMPTFTALENVQIPMFESDLPASQRRRRAAELLDAVGMGHRLNHLPPKLSGGERQRVAIARSLANGPSCLLADEPTGNLDSENAVMILDMLQRIHREQKVALIMVTHDLGIARSAQRIVQMKDGRVEEEKNQHPAT